ncbi:single-stranded DNA-binding protein [Candidatus Gribaldobacteria bacterium]|nr:single-stranded DNA-binding protein [Candidatus Gribaldobacteria bacterium]
MNFNKAIVLGRLTADPERRSLPSGDPVVSFSVASNRYYTSQGEKKEDVEFHNIVIFGRMAETASQYLKKGSIVLIEGHLKTRTWQDQQGQKHYKTEIVAESMQLGPRNEPSSSSANANNRPTITKQVKSKAPIKMEDIPVIQEDEPISPADDNKDSKENPFEDDEAEIDVKDIPF